MHISAHCGCSRAQPHAGCLRAPHHSILVLQTWGLVQTLEGLALAQVRAMVDLLPAITVVADDPFNSSPTDPKLMGPDALRRHRAGERLLAAQMPTPLVRARSCPPPYACGLSGLLLPALSAPARSAACCCLQRCLLYARC